MNKAPAYVIPFNTKLCENSPYTRFLYYLNTFYQMIGRSIDSFNRNNLCRLPGSCPDKAYENPLRKTNN